MKYKPEFAKQMVSGRLLDPQEIANAALYLASDAASGVTGHVMEVDMGANANI